MEDAALGAELKRYSLRLSATSVPATIALMSTTLAMRPLIRSSDYVVTRVRHAPLNESLPTLWQRPVHGQLKEHSLFLVGLHQRAASFFIVRVGIHNTLGILNVFVDAAEIVFVLRPHHCWLGRDFLQ